MFQTQSKCERWNVDEGEEILAVVDFILRPV